SSPIWRAACPRWLRRLRMCSSRSLILERQSSRSIRAPDADLSANSAKYRRTPWAAQVLQPRQLVDGEPTRLSRGERAEAERAEADTTEPYHRMLEGRAVTLDLAIAPFAERDLDPRGLRPGAEEAHAGRDSGAVGQHDTATPAREVAGAHPPGHLRPVHARELVARMEETIGEIAVVGEEEETFHVVVETPHRKDARGAGRQQVHHHATPLRVAEARHVATRLVEEEVGRGLSREHGMAV